MSREPNLQPPFWFPLTPLAHTKSSSQLVHKLFPHPKSSQLVHTPFYHAKSSHTKRLSRRTKLDSNSSSNNQAQRDHSPGSTRTARPHAHLIITHGAPPPCSALFSAGTPLLGVPFPSRPIGPGNTPCTRQSDRRGVAWSQGNHPPKTGPHLF